MDIAEWLRSLGLARYAPAFRDNDVDGEILRRLTAEDLRDLGVVSVGHRRRLLDAIAGLRSGPEHPDSSVAGGGSPLPTPGTPAHTGGPPAPAEEEGAATEAERRQLSVMFCDLVGSTALSLRFDPEDLRQIVRAYHRAVAGAVARFDGFVAKYMGDGVLAYFGYPQAHEDDAERAVRAGLAVIEAVVGLGAQEALKVRLGIATGLVVVGDHIGTGSAHEQTVVGETPNLAARMQGVAQPGEVVIADSTRRQIGALFDLEDLGPRILAGFAGPQRAWRVVGESGVASRFEALRSAAALVGRDEELDLVLRRWERAKGGEGGAVLIAGEPGIGKSRLAEALSQAIAHAPHTRLHYSCSPYHQDSALYPFIVQLERAAGFARNDTDGEKLGKLRDLLVPSARRDDEIELVAELLSLPSRAAELSLSPQRRREALFEALLHQLAMLAWRRPVLMVFEDAHWIDPTSRELLDLTLDRVAGLPVLLIVTLRPELQHSWGGRPHVSNLALNRLGERDGAVLVERLAGNAGLAREIVGEIVERADGVPLFVEELTKAVLESAAFDNRVAAVPASRPLPNLAIPATLHASLVARLDRLGPGAREVAQTGAVIGREFAYELIEAVAQRSAVELRSGLDRLTAAGLLLSRGSPPHSSYLFKHALVQDAAYVTLLRSRRQALHAEIAAAIEREFPEIATTQPELLAHHCTEAGQADRAVQYWHRAGERATARSANLEAIAHLTRGIEMLAGLPQSPLRDEEELELQAALVTPLWATRGFGSAEAEQAARRAVELAPRAGIDSPAHFRAIYGLRYSYLLRGNLRAGRPLAEQLLDLAARLREPELFAYAHFELGVEQLFSAELAGARQHLEQGIARYDPRWGRAAALRHGFNCASNCHAFLTRVLWHLGYPDEALRHSREAIALARDIAHPFSQGVALSWTTALHQLRGETEQTRERAEALVAFATEQAFPFLAAQAMVFRGWALVQQGLGAQGLVQLRAGLAAYRATGAELESSHWLGLLAEACHCAGQAEEGMRVVAEALDHVARTGIVYYEPELHRLHGELWLRRDRPDAGKAEACLGRALETAGQQQAKSWELRAATSLARLRRDQGRRAEARDLLAPVYGRFTEGFDTADLKTAKTQLDELV
jgi:class 3 adenylate cyclase/predicted ATPase